MSSLGRSDGWFVWRILMAQGKVDEAEVLLSLLIGNDPYDIGLHYLRGIACEASGDLQGAIEEYTFIITHSVSALEFVRMT